MADLREALAATNGMAQASRPPGLREARGRDRCGSCTYWKAKNLMSGEGACRLYAGYPTHENQLSSAFKPKRGA